MNALAALVLGGLRHRTGLLKGDVVRGEILFLRSVCFAMLVTLFAQASQAAEKKQWVRLDPCRYLVDKNNDGDSFLVQCGRESFYVRLYFVDAPETNMSFPERVRQQYEYFGVTLDELTRAGARAHALVQSVLGKQPFVIYTKRSFAQGRSQNIRYYGLVQIDGRYLHEVLLRKGLARNKGTRTGLPTGEKARAHNNALQSLEDRARVGRKGVWATHVPANRVLKRNEY